ncbi:MAG: DEAD/DEAH box helicase [Candidatus Bathyarchaeia archaeon]
MFDDYARSLFQDFPEFDGLIRDNALRALSSAYLAIIQYRVNGTIDGIDEFGKVQSFLRRLANTLIYHVVLDEGRKYSERQAAGFVADEAIALMADYLAAVRDVSGVDKVDEIRSAERIARVESSLLYLFSRYDACASGVLSLAPPVADADALLVDRAAAWCFDRLERLCRLALFPSLSSDFDYSFSFANELTPQELEADTVSRLFVELGKAAIIFASWLGGEQDGLSSATGRLDAIIKALSIEDANADNSLLGYEFSRIFHLATLMQLCFPAIGERALIHVMPHPPNGDLLLYRRYLRARATGDSDSLGRPVLWPSAFEYVRECLLGDTRHAVVAMPTGSGKSFVAELAVSQAVYSGWVLYLAPTNVLTEQVRGDLRKALKDLQTQIFAFIGDQEYSIFTAERVDQMPTNSVAVMTPEKCALALRLSPDTFKDCRLVVFDECHLLGDTGSSRGPVAELVVTQLMIRAPDCRFLLMSAIVQNPEELAEWLADATGNSSKAVTIRWRPTRTLRAVLGLDNNSIQKRAEDAIEKLQTRSEKIKRLGFNSECALAVSLQGAWQSEEMQDYAITPVNCEAPLKLFRKKQLGKWKYFWEGDSWVNECATSLGTTLAESGIQTLIFTPASKHYPFSNGKKVRLTDQLLDTLPAGPNLVSVCRTLSEYELGCESQVFSLLDSGVAVHTSLMLEPEKIATELMFRARSVPIMFATGTLAQGLNLPAIAVIIAGSRIGDTRGEDQTIVQRRKFSQLLNAAGRAGRAGFANQGLVIAIPDKPVAFDDFESVKRAREQVDYLQQSDDSVRVQSGLTAFLDSVCQNALRSDQADDIELQVVSLLAGGDDNQIEPAQVLRRTYAAYLRRKAGAAEVTEDNANHLVRMGTEFIAETGAPVWLTVAAQRAGLDFFLTLAISKAWARVRSALPEESNRWSVVEWREELLRLIVHIPPGLLKTQLPAVELKYISKQFKKIVEDMEALFNNRKLDWEPPDLWAEAWKTANDPLDAWMAGKSFLEIGSIITGDPVEDISYDRTAGKPLPKALSVSQGAWSSLSLIAGGFLAIAEQILDGEVPLALASLPMCIKYGCDSPETLAWFRFGVRLRRPSRLLATRFPPPALETDEQLKEWVRLTKREWLATEMADDEVMTAIRKFITND